MIDKEGLKIKTYHISKADGGIVSILLEVNDQLKEELSKVKGELERWMPDDEYEVRFYDRKYNICVGNMKPVDAVGFNVVVETNPPDDECEHRWIQSRLPGIGIMCGNCGEVKKPTTPDDETFKEENKIDNFLDELGILEECKERAKELKVPEKYKAKVSQDGSCMMLMPEDGMIIMKEKPASEERNNLPSSDECAHIPDTNHIISKEFIDEVNVKFNFCPICGVDLREEECDE